MGSCAIGLSTGRCGSIAFGKLRRGSDMKIISIFAKKGLFFSENIRHNTLAETKETRKCAKSARRFLKPSAAMASGRRCTTRSRVGWLKCAFARVESACGFRFDRMYPEKPESHIATHGDADMTEDQIERRVER